MFFSKETEQIDIYYMEMPKNKDINNQVIKILDEEEQNYYFSCKGSSRKDEILYGRIFLKTIIGHYLNISPYNISLSKGEHGKLYYRNNSDEIYFNISHTNNIIACAFCLEYEIGVDIEKITRDVRKIASSYFAKEEIEYINTFPEEEKNNIACKLWTLKEAYVKAKGKGLLIPLNSFNVLESSSMEFYTRTINDNYYLSFAVDNIQKYKFDIRVKEIDFNSLLGFVGTINE